MAEPPAPAFVDTSVIVRYLTDDPPALAEHAARLLEGDEQLVVSEVVLVETAYVLTKVYEVSREATVDALVELVQRRNVALLEISKPLAIEALRLCRASGRVAFADAFVWAQARHARRSHCLHLRRKIPDAGPREGVHAVESAGHSYLSSRRTAWASSATCSSSGCRR